MGKDVAIFGAGIIGCTTAYFLASAGVDVTVVDPVGVAAGASGRNNGLIEHPYDAETAPLYEETVSLLREALGDAMPAAPAGTLLIAESEAGAHALVEHYEQFPVLHPQLLTPSEARVAEPLLAPGLWGCLLQTGYPIRPLEATRAFAELARQAGADFITGPDQAARPDQVTYTDSAIWHHNDEDITPNRLLEDPNGPLVVVAAGAATPDVLAGYVRPDIVAPLWGVIVSIQLPQRPRHPLIEGTLAIAQGGGELVNESPFTLLDSPSYLAVGSTMLPGREPNAGEWASRLLNRGARFVPLIEQARVLGTLVCARPRSYDNRPILGRVPGQDRLWIATGHGGRGMSLGAASGRLMAEAIIAGNDEAIPPQLSAARLSDR